MNLTQNKVIPSNERADFGTHPFCLFGNVWPKESRRAVKGQSAAEAFGVVSFDMGWTSLPAYELNEVRESHVIRITQGGVKRVSFGICRLKFQDSLQNRKLSSGTAKSLA